MFSRELASCLSKCISCGACNDSCPLVRFIDGNETLGPRARISIFRAIDMGIMRISVDAIEYLYECGLCSLCDRSCPLDIEVSKLILGIRAELIKLGYVPPYEIAKVRNSLLDTMQPWSREHRKGKWLPPDYSPSEEANVLFFSGCWANRAPEMASSAFFITETLLGSKVYCLGENEPCCGQLLRIAGYEETYKDYLVKFREHICDRGIEKVLVLCESCKATMKDLGLEVSTLLEELCEERLLKKLRKRRRKPKSRKVAFLPTCPPRYEHSSLLEKFMGEKFVEMPSWFCMSCGFSLSEIASLKTLEQMVDGIFRVLEDEKVDLLVVADPFSYWLLSESRNKRKAKTEIIDLYSFLVERIKA